MLVLTRRLGETIIIDNEVRVTVLDVKGDRVRIGIAAPPTVVVDRQEVHERRLRYNPRRDAEPVFAGHELEFHISHRM
jgi:carbon storage regulator